METPSDSPKKCRSVGCTFLIILFAAINLIIGYYVFKHHEQCKLFEKERLAQNQQVATILERFNEEQLAVGAFERKLEKLSNPLSTHDKAWVVRAIAKQVELFNLSLRFTRNRLTVIHSLKQIEHALMDWPALSAVRQAIAHDLQRLGSVPSVDWRSLLKQITDLQRQISYLPVPGYVNKPVDSTVHHEGWGWRLLQALHVTVHHHRDLAQTLPTDLEKATIKQASYLLLQQAKWAVLNEHQELYQYSLQQVIHYLEAYFSHWQLKTESLVSDLTKLKQETIAPDLPLLTETKIALDHILDKANP